MHRAPRRPVARRAVGVGVGQLEVAEDDVLRIAQDHGVLKPSAGIDARTRSASFRLEPDRETRSTLCPDEQLLRPRAAGAKQHAITGLEYGFTDLLQRAPRFCTRSAGIVVVASPRVHMV